MRCRTNPLSPSAGEGQPRSGRERGRKKLLLGRAKQMRTIPTDAEHRLWQILRAKRFAGHKFKRQLVVDHYLVDFACLQRRLIIEADGGHHAENARDQRRDSYLTAQGFQILRIWNNDIFNNEAGVGDAIFAALQSPLPNPSPAEGRGAKGAPNA